MNSWSMFEKGNGNHVIPNDDIIEHTFDSDCQCKPEIQIENGILIFIHDALDGRLGIEWANKILNN